MAKAKAAAPNSATSNPESSAVQAVPIRILKIGTCPSLSGKSTLTYHIGCTTDSKDIHCRVYENSGGGFFNSEWTPLAVIKQLLAKHPSEKPITSHALYEIFSGKSSNSAPFLFAILKAEGLVQPAKEKRRCYEVCSATKFLADIETLVSSNIDLKVAEKPAKAAKNTAKKEPAVVKAEAVAAISTQRFEPISKQPWPIKEKASKAVPKKA